MPVPPAHALIFSLLLFAVGVLGVLTRRNAIIILMSIELMMNAANINFIAFGLRSHRQPDGHLPGRDRDTIYVDEVHIMKG